MTRNSGRHSTSLLTKLSTMLWWRPLSSIAAPIQTFKMSWSCCMTKQAPWLGSTRQSAKSLSINLICRSQTVLTCLASTFPTRARSPGSHRRGPSTSSGAVSHQTLSNLRVQAWNPCTQSVSKKRLQIGGVASPFRHNAKRTSITNDTCMQHAQYTSKTPTLITFWSRAAHTRNRLHR